MLEMEEFTAFATNTHICRRGTSFDLKKLSRVFFYDFPVTWQQKPSCLVAATLSGYVSGWDSGIRWSWRATLLQSLAQPWEKYLYCILKTLMSCFRCVWLGLELNSAGTPGPPGSLLFIEICWISGFISFLADLTRFPAHSLGVLGVGMKPRPLPTELLLQSPVLWGRALWTSQRGIRDK